ncbi:hypothetical protein [Hydrogenophaga electricum]|uniref:Uncharacterized protein n=1 Tax=Hydrogenophaga electricum TaxID=1230953 RepID=A0ABQ6C435_9BURK|nr:hypothetical protein [Hydrogenophaga electricum]GLS15088.1 hypothetical protein GCM10007935_25210 [Hydrogenophaga electricum]
MIHVVSIGPAQDHATAWFAYDDADFARKVAATDPLAAWEIHDVATVAELLADQGHDTVDAAAQAACPALCALGARYGWEHPLYRADHLLGRGVLSEEPVSVRSAFEAALQARPGTHRLYGTDTEAVGAFEGADPWLCAPAHWRARHALHQQLLALDVLADNL